MRVAKLLWQAVKRAVTLRGFTFPLLAASAIVVLAMAADFPRLPDWIEWVTLGLIAVVVLCAATSGLARLGKTTFPGTLLAAASATAAALGLCWRWAERPEPLSAFGIALGSTVLVLTLVATRFSVVVLRVASAFFVAMLALLMVDVGQLAEREGALEIVPGAVPPAVGALGVPMPALTCSWWTRRPQTPRQSRPPSVRVEGSSPGSAGRAS